MEFNAVPLMTYCDCLQNQAIDSDTEIVYNIVYRFGL